MDRPKMDRPREVRGTPFTREAKRLLKAGLLITAVVLVVGSLPVLAIWFMSGDEEPPGPVAYRDEAVRIPSGDIELVGQLRLPVGGGPFPALVVAHGSGRVTRDQYEQIGADLAINGFALLSYDKRGVGESGGEYFGVGPQNAEEALGLLADDVLAGVHLLQSRPDIRASSVGILGISQGGWIGPLAASRSDDVAFVAIISGPAVSVGEEIYYSELTGEREGVSLDLSDEELSRKLAEFDGPRGYDPRPVLAELDTPTLWLLGEADRSIPIPETIAVLDGLVAAGRPVTEQVLPGVGHGMRNVATGERVATFPMIFGWLVKVGGR